MAGNHHQRLGGYVGGISPATMNQSMHRVVAAINSELKAEFLKFPDNQELEMLAQENLDKYKLPGFAFGVDGCHFLFQERPRYGHIQ